MEITDFTTNQGRASLQKFRRLLARAVTECKPNTAANAWLDALLDQALVNIAADASLARVAGDTDSLSHNSRPELVAELTRAVSRSSTYGGDFKTQLDQDIDDAIAELAA